MAEDEKATEVFSLRVTRADLERIEALVERVKGNARIRGLKGTIATRKSVVMAGIDLLEQHLNKLDRDRDRKR